MINVQIRRTSYCLAFACLASLATAQDKLDHPSLELLVGTWPTVVVGTVTDITETSFTVGIDETIKGSPIKPVTLSYWDSKSPTLAKLLKSRQQRLWFLNLSDKQKATWNLESE